MQISGALTDPQPSLDNCKIGVPLRQFFAATSFLKLGILPVDIWCGALGPEL